MSIRKLIKTAVAIVLTLPAGISIAQEAGTVSFATGDVTAERQPPVALVKGDGVFATDTIATGERSRAQLAMVDGANTG